VIAGNLCFREPPSITYGISDRISFLTHYKKPSILDSQKALFILFFFA